MTITKQQFADLLDGLGSAWISSGAYEGLPTVTAIGNIFLKAMADEIRENPTETYEIPPERTSSEEGR